MYSNFSQLRTFSISCFMATLVTFGVEAQTLKVCDVNDDCSGLSGAQQKACYADILDAEDQRLNDTYVRVLQKIRNTGFNDPATIEDNLKKSQRQWISYRDSYCNFRFSTAEGATIGGLLELDCKCTLTRDQSDHLTDDLSSF